MRIISASATNFASYKTLEFDFQNQGLTLLSGATGSGKSTLCDLALWVLFGTTVKGGPVSDVLAWPGNEVTTGLATVETRPGVIYDIIRTRGPKPKDNDLYMMDAFCYTNKENALRGKDILDTQRCINMTLGTDADLYLAAAYYHEFSQTAQFFTTTAKNRRVICEQLVDLSLPTKLQEKLVSQIKGANTNLTGCAQSIRDNEFRLEQVKKARLIESSRVLKWEAAQKQTIAYVTSCYDKFEKNRKRMISKSCNSCGTVLEHPKEIHDTSENPHLVRLAELEAETCPFTDELKDFSAEITKYSNFIKVDRETESFLRQKVADYEVLQDVVQLYRSSSIVSAIQDIENTTNNFLTTYFDAEIKVIFSVEAADKLDVSLLKDGNVCSFTQLSKGQRCLLKLCFGVAVMKSVSNHHGLSFKQAFFDEALDGLDETMKAKAFRMLETIALDYDSVFVVEHSEGLKALFNNAYTVSLIDGKSHIEKA